MAPTANVALKEEEEMKLDLGKFWKESRPSLTEAEFLDLLEPVCDHLWSRRDEQELDKERRTDYWHKWLMTSCKFTGQGARSAIASFWRLFPRLYRRLPTDLFCLENKIQVQRSPDKILWTKDAYDQLAAFISHGFWTWNADLDFPLMTQLLQLAVRSRKNDCREWALVNHTYDRFVDELILELKRDNEAAGENSSILQVLDRVDHILEARNTSKWKTRPGQMQTLFRAIVTRTFDETRDKQLGAYKDDEYYEVGVHDLKALNDALDKFGPADDRPELRERISGMTWKRLMNKARGATLRPDLPHTNEEMAKVISVASLKWKRDTIRAQRLRDAYIQPAGSQHLAGQTRCQIWRDGPFWTSASSRSSSSFTAARKEKGTSTVKGGGDGGKKLVMKPAEKPAKKRGRAQKDRRTGSRGTSNRFAHQHSLELEGSAGSHESNSTPAPVGYDHGDAHLISEDAEDGLAEGEQDESEQGDGCLRSPTASHSQGQIRCSDPYDAKGSEGGLPCDNGDDTNISPGRGSSKRRRSSTSGSSENGESSPRSKSKHQRTSGIDESGPSSDRRVDDMTLSLPKAAEVGGDDQQPTEAGSHVIWGNVEEEEGRPSEIRQMLQKVLDDFLNSRQPYNP